MTGQGAAGDIVTVGKQRGIKCDGQLTGAILLTQPRTIAHGMVAPTVRIGIPTAVKLI